MQEYPENPGYRAEPGWVKGNPQNNEIYLARCKEAYPEWADHLEVIDIYLRTMVPGYNIGQIKSKFGGLRYYWNAPEGFEGDVRTPMEVVWKLEAEAPPLAPNV